MALAKALAAAGCEVAVACRVDAMGEAITNAGLQLFPLEMSRASLNPFHLAACVARINKVYRTFQPHVVHRVALKPALLGGLAAWFGGRSRAVNAVAGLGYVFTSRSPRARLLRPVVNAALRLLLDNASTRIIVQNAEDAETLIGRGIAARERVRLIPGAGVDLDRFRPSAEPSGPPRTALVSRLIEDKGLREAVAATRLLRERGTQIRLSLAGARDTGSPAALPEDLLAEWTREEGIEVLGFVGDIPALWAASHMAVLPSYYGEGVPLALIEAAASGRPMIAANGPGLRDIVRHGETGLLVPPRDVPALADAMARLAADPGLRRRMGQAARRLAEERFGDQAVIGATLEVYRDLLGDLWPAT